MGENAGDEKVIAYLEEHGEMLQEERDFFGSPYHDEGGELVNHINNDASCKGVVRGNKVQVFWEYLDDELVSVTANGYGCECGLFPTGSIVYWLRENLDEVESIA